MNTENHPFTSGDTAAPASTLPPPSDSAALAAAVVASVTAGEVLGAEELAPAGALLDAATAPAGEGVAGGMPAVSLEDAMTAADLKLASLPRPVRVRLHLAGLLRSILEEIGEETKARTPPGQQVEIDPAQFWAEFVLPVFSVLGVELQELGCYTLEEAQTALILAWTSPPDLAGGAPPA